MDPGKQAQEFFSRYAPAYTVSPSHRAGEDLHRLVALLAPAGRGRLLDVATGSGHTALAMASWVDEAVGLDLTPAMGAEFMRQARAHGFLGMRFVVGAVEALPFPDGAFQWVTCRRAAHHFPDLPQALAEMKRVLAPNGRIGIVDMIAPADPEAARFLNELERIRDPSHQRALGLKEWREQMQGTGLSLIAVEVVEEIQSWEQWWFPVPLDSAAAERALAYVSQAGPEAGEVLLPHPKGVMIRKRRGIMVAIRQPSSTSLPGSPVDVADPLQGA
ncbi:class I SAM-dependent methyltransferase [Thermoflexus sp.]|uniref:class I SAM-dependent methyltransferase n=1 Tax=Thermoflexus sp. TaxID=1969742 RepID=UPI00185F15B2|nr:methyltransferase domain-containing protein [Thermoflexus sp.]